MTSIVLSIKNDTQFKFSRSLVEKTILNTLKSKNLQGIFEIELKLVTKNSIQTLNKQYRHKDIPTDVLSFPIQDKIEKNNPAPILLGDIVVCPAIIKKNAAEFNSTIEKEFLKMIEHSTLHLVGVHHKDD